MDLLEQYIFNLYKIQEERRVQITEVELRMAADAVGLTESEMTAIEQMSFEQLTRAQSYMRIQRWSEAENELNKALQINRMRVEFVFAMAELKWKQYRGQHRRKLLTMADSYAQEALALVPGYLPAERLLMAIDERKKKIRIKRWVGYSVLSLVVPFLALLLFVFLRDIIRHNTPTGMEGEKYDVSVVVVPHPELEGVDLKFMGGQIVHPDYTGSSSFDFKFSSTLNGNDFEIEELGFRASFRDEDDKEVADAFYWFWYEGQMTLRPHQWFYYRESQTWSSGYFSSKPRKVKMVKMEVQAIRRYKGASKYLGNRSLEFNWICARTEGLDLGIMQQSNIVSVLNETDRRTEQKLLLEIENKGVLEFRELVLQIEWFNELGEVLENQLLQVIQLSEPPLIAKDKIVFFLDKNFDNEGWGYPKPFHSFKVSVKSAR